MVGYYHPVADADANCLQSSQEHSCIEGSGPYGNHAAFCCKMGDLYGCIGDVGIGKGASGTGGDGLVSGMLWSVRDKEPERPLDEVCRAWTQSLDRIAPGSVFALQRGRYTASDGVWACSSFAVAFPQPIPRYADDRLGAGNAHPGTTLWYRIRHKLYVPAVPSDAGISSLQQVHRAFSDPLDRLQQQGSFEAVWAALHARVPPGSLEEALQADPRDIVASVTPET